MRVLAVLISAMLVLPVATALYADITIEVLPDGRTVIEGTTNVPNLVGESHAYTAKQGERWLFNLSTPLLETFVYNVRLPVGAQINYVNGKNARITTENDHVVVRGSGADALLEIVVQYELERTRTTFSWLPLAGIVLLVGALSFILARRRASRPKKEVLKARAPSYIEGLPERQQAIITLLRDAGGTLTQRQLEFALKLPKSSVSRNVEALRRRGIIEKAQLGMTNTVVLADAYR